MGQLPLLPDEDKRPRVHCPGCDAVVAVFEYFNTGDLYFVAHEDAVGSPCPQSGFGAGRLT